MGDETNITFTGDAYCGWRPGNSDPSPAGTTTSFYPGEGCGGNVEGVFEHNVPNPDTGVPGQGLQLRAAVIVGSNAPALQLAGLNDPTFPLDVPQLSVGYQRGDFFVGIGREPGLMGFPGYQATGRDFARTSTDYPHVPFTQAALRVGFRARDGQSSVVAGLSAGADRVRDNNTLPYGFITGNYRFNPLWSGFANFEVGPEREGLSTEVRMTGDVGITYENVDADRRGTRVQLYGYLRRDPQEGGHIAYLPEAYAYLRHRFHVAGPVDAAVVARAGISDFEWQNVNVAGGLNLYLPSGFEVRAQWDHNEALGNARPFDVNPSVRGSGQAVENTIGVQVIYSASTSIGN